MKKINILYWIFTGLLVPTLAIGSVFELMGHPDSKQVMISLGYPLYLSPFLGIARLLALVAIFTPGFHRIKEWAYAGLVFDIIGAIYSLVAAGHPVSYTTYPFIILVLVFGSYFLYNRKTELRARTLRLTAQ